MNFTYEDWKKIEIGSKDYDDICRLLFEQYGKNLKAVTVKGEELNERIKSLTAIINDRNLMETRELESLIENIKEEKITSDIVKMAANNDYVKYYYLAAKVGEVCGNQRMENFFKNLYEKIIDKKE